MKKLTLKTKEGCWRLFALFLVLILVFSFAARMVSSAGGKVKISRVTFDSRGAIIDAELYYPSGTSDEDKLPAVIVTHGAGVEKGCLRGISEEIARRGMVVLNVNGYANSLSEQPPYDETDQGVDEFDNIITPSGLYDSLNFLRTLNFVDQTRIGMTGHSMGSRRVAYAAMLDCGFLSLNDILINILCDEFGQEFTLEEISCDADELAEERLNADQLAHYNTLRAEKEAWYNTRVKSICLIGSGGDLDKVQTVEVGGYEVQRNCQVNFAIINGYWDISFAAYPSQDIPKEAWHTGTEDIARETWYIIDDVNSTSSVVGTLTEVSVADNEEFRQAIQNRSTRIACFNYETHSKNFFSKDTASDVVKYFEQTLEYNNGNLGDADTHPLDSENSIFMYREVFNCLAMISMIGFVVSLAAALLNSKFFNPCVVAVTTQNTKANRKKYWPIILLGIAVEFIAIYVANSVMVPGTISSSFLPYFLNQWYVFIFLGILAVGSAIMLVLFKIVDKKDTSFSLLHLKMKAINIAKTVLLTVILLAAAYFVLTIIVYLFNQDFRFWMVAFTEMKVEYWRYIWRYAICMLPLYLLIGASTNYTIRRDIPQWRDTCVTVVVNSLGIFLCCGVNYLMLVSSTTLWSSFQSTYGILFLVPITVYFTRKMYNLTNSIWLGALTNSFFIAWNICSSMGLHVKVYNAQSWISNFFNI